MPVKTLSLEIATPEALLFTGPVEWVTLQGVEGEFGVYPEHTPLIAQLAAGPVVYSREGKTSRIEAASGFAHVTTEAVVVLIGGDLE